MSFHPVPRSPLYSWRDKAEETDLFFYFKAEHFQCILIYLKQSVLFSMQELDYIQCITNQSPINIIVVGDGERYKS